MNVNCPTCKIEIQWSKENAYRPFCSHRCQLIDLGAWAAEEHSIPGEPAFHESRYNEEAILPCKLDEEVFYS